MMKRKRQRKLSLGFFLIVLCVILTGCSSVSYHWYTEPDCSVKFSVKAGKVQRLLIITNVSQLESMKLNEEKNWLEAMNIRDYFPFSSIQKTSSWFIIQARVKAESYSIILILQCLSMIWKMKMLPRYWITLD